MALSEVPWQIVSKFETLKAYFPDNQKISMLQLVHDDDSCGKNCTCFKKVTIESTIAVPAMFINSIDVGVWSTLLSNIARYIPELDAIWVTATRIHIKSTGAHMTNSDPSIHLLVPIQVEALVLRPQVKSILSGRVQYVDKGGITLTTHGVATALIPRYALPEGWDIAAKGIYSWGGADGYQLEYPSIQMGTLVRFVLNSLKSRCGNAIVVLDGQMKEIAISGVLNEDNNLVSLPDLSKMNADLQALTPS